MKYPAPFPGEDEEEKPGDTYEGAFQHGKRCGKAAPAAQQPVQPSSPCSPEARATHSSHCYLPAVQGKYTWGVSGAVYEGQYLDNKKQGKGRMTYPDKSVYEGDWVADLHEGTGRYVYGNGDLYHGSFKAGKRHGTGTYHYQHEGCQIVGEWEEGGVTRGHWVHRDGSMFQGSFKAGLQPVGGWGDAQSVCPAAHPLHFLSCPAALTCLCVQHEGVYFFSTSHLLQRGSLQPNSTQPGAPLTWHVASSPIMQCTNEASASPSAHVAYTLARAGLSEL
ncbi:hypothetical protein QJQ45_022202 [Haematococcus lacustris]|nr:hypothetical protein QJQ45_022202 [Haematococcus lacustris]